MVRSLVVLLSLLVPWPAWADDSNPEFRPRVCMIEDRVKAQAGLPVEIGGKIYSGCCPDCGGALKKEPERSTRAIDPVTGNEVDKATAFLFEYEGDAYYFESESSRAEFARDPGHFTTRIKPEGSKPR